MFLPTPKYFYQKLTNSAKQKYLHTISRILLCLFVCSSFSLAYADDSAIRSPNELVKLLQHGGYIMYIRHAATDHSQRDKDLSDFSKCELQRNLSQQGKDESRVLSNAIKTLSIKIGDVYTSPYCRCIDTAKIAFGRYEILNDMRATFVANLEESNLLVSVLKRQLSTIPKQGFNTVLLGHTANLRELTQIWPKPEGVTHIFKPQMKNGYQYLGQITPKDWALLSIIK